ncbi:hypothetical protein B0H14DRAFT_2632471 [Mycena olivaceomarginata]|nr:hypothetical protein B0H14DRAFT_2632471 [Mycena olivaceomarginata]
MAYYVFSPPMPSPYGHKITLCRASQQQPGNYIGLVPIMDIKVPVDGRDAFRPGLAPHRWSIQTTELFLGETESGIRTYEGWHETVEVQVTPELLRIHIFNFSVIQPESSHQTEVHSSPLRLMLFPSGVVRVYGSRPTGGSRVVATLLPGGILKILIQRVGVTSAMCVHCIANC